MVRTMKRYIEKRYKGTMLDEEIYTALEEIKDYLEELYTAGDINKRQLIILNTYAAERCGSRRRAFK